MLAEHIAGRLASFVSLRGHHTSRILCMQALRLSCIELRKKKIDEFNAATSSYEARLASAMTGRRLILNTHPTSMVCCIHAYKFVGADICRLSARLCGIVADLMGLSKWLLLAWRL